MPYTFGAATADDITWTTGNSTLFGPSSIDLVSMWVYPTTLTAGRALWSNGQITNAKIHTTTSELIVTLDGNNTDGTFATSGLGLVINVWQFLAFAVTQTADTAYKVIVWIGTLDNRPVASGMAAPTNSVDTVLGSTSFTIGNLGTGTVAFQGDIANVAQAHGTGLLTAADLLPIATYGAITAAEQLLCEQWFILPMWQGDYACLSRPAAGNNAVVKTSRFFCELRTSQKVACQPASAIDPAVMPVVNGATISNNACPRPPLTFLGMSARNRVSY